MSDSQAPPVWGPHPCAARVGRLKAREVVNQAQRYGLVQVTQQSNGRLAPKVSYKRVELTMELGA